MNLLPPASDDVAARQAHPYAALTPDVVMAEAYARLEVTDTRLAASGAIFRSGESWYGLAFDCTLSDDLHV